MPPGTKPGDLIHFFQGGTIQIPTIGSIDPAGNLWVANNWNSVEAATSADPIPSHLNLGRRVGLYRHLRSRGPGENPALGHGAQALEFSPHGFFKTNWLSTCGLQPDYPSIRRFIPRLLN